MICYTPVVVTRKTETFLKLLTRKQVIRSRDLDRAGIPRNYLNRLVERGQLRKIERGLYGVPELKVSEHMTLVDVVDRIPKAVICLLSALRFHDIGTQMPSEVWIALDVKAWTPKIKYPPVRIVRFSGKALRFGVQEHDVQSGRVRVYSPAKTVADCFKFRYKIGSDIAVEALRECLREKKATVDQLWEAAKVCRVANVMRPYMESLA
jgi:predicted transcriptional regulator of viral defense system